MGFYPWGADSGNAVLGETGEVLDVFAAARRLRYPCSPMAFLEELERTAQTVEQHLSDHLTAGGDAPTADAAASDCGRSS
jgi:hypothetical protein